MDMTSIIFGDAIYCPLCLHINKCQHFAALCHLICSPCQRRKQGLGSYTVWTLTGEEFQCFPDNYTVDRQFESSRPNALGFKAAIYCSGANITAQICAHSQLALRPFHTGHGSLDCLVHFHRDCVFCIPLCCFSIVFYINVRQTKGRFLLIQQGKAKTLREGNNTRLSALRMN